MYSQAQSHVFLYFSFSKCIYINYVQSFYTFVGKPQEQQLHDLFTPKYAVQWKRIGNLLGVDDSTLENIASETQNAEESCNALWKVWLSNSINPTWHNAYQAVDIVTVTMELQDSYIRERNNDQGEIWASSYQPKHIANVSLICYDERRTTLKQVEAIAKVTHSGIINTDVGSPLNKQSSDRYISGCKRTSCISDIFEPDILEDKRLPCLTPKLILIEGAPGIGKTILSREIAFQWASEKLLNHVHLLFLVPLRDPQISQIKSLEQFVCYAIKSASNTKHIIDYLVKYSGKYCTIVFDGYDEFSEEAKENSFVGKIIKRNILQHCSLVITSRPSASIDLHRIIDHRVEILGFTKDNRNEYIRGNLKGDEIKKINEYLQNNPFINNLCYIPLNMTILLCLFKGYTNPDSSELPETQTDINVQFIYITMSRFISKQKNENITIKSPNDLPKPYKKQFNTMCRLAFNLLGSDKIVFGDDDIQKCIPGKSTTNWNTLGLLREASYYSVMDNKAIKSYSFVHLSMQECLAAHYIAEEAENFFLKNHFWDSRYLNTGIMYVGLTKGKSQLFKNFLSGRSGSLSRQLGAGKVTVHSKVEKLHFFHCLLEAKSDELSEQLKVSKVIYDNVIDLSDQVLQQNDIHTLSFFVSRSTIKQWLKLDLSNCSINDEGLENFSATFFNSEVTNVTIITMDLSDNNLSSNSINATINLINYFKVKHLIIADGVVETLEFKAALLSSVNKVEEVVISGSGESSQFLINYKHDDMEQTFINQLQFKNHLYAWNANILLSLTHLIVKCNTIIVYEENLPDDSIDGIASEVKTVCEERNKTFTYLLQSANKIIAYKAEFYQIIQSICDKKFSKHDSSWKTFDLRQCNIGDENFSELNKVLSQYNVEYLDKLIISKCSLTSLCIPTLLEILKCCVIKHLKISDDLICRLTLSDLIMTETATEAKIKNFRMRIPLMLSTTKTSKIFFVDCTFNDSVLSKDYDFENSQLYFTNVKLNENNIESFLKLCRNNTKQINVLDMNMADEIVNDVFSELKRFQNNAYLLASTRRLIAYNVNQQQIMEAIANNSDITTLQLINCKINFSKLFPLSNLLSNSSHNWKLIDFSRCNIKDEGCLDLYECFTANKNKIIIEELNLSSNRLSSPSVIAILKFLEFCIIKILIISKNNIAVYKFHKQLHMHLLANKLILNFSHEIPLIVYESEPPHEICNVYAFEKSDMGVFLSREVTEVSTLYNLYQVKFELQYSFNLIFSTLVTESSVKVYVLVEGTMTEKIRDIITEVTKYKSKFDYSDVSITDEFCKILCNSLLNDNSSLHVIEELDFSSQQFSLSYAPVIIESLQYCVIKRIVLPNIAVLDKISETIIKDFHAGKSILNFTERIPLTINIETEIGEDEEDGITYDIIANTYLQNYKIKEELFDHYNDLVIKEITTSHTFVLLDCLKANTLNRILSILYSKESYIKISMFEIKLTDDVLEATVNHLKRLKKEIYRDRLQYVLASDSKIVAYNAKHFHTLQALQIKPMIYDLEIIHCFISNDQLKTLISQFNLLKNIKLIACKLKDKGLFDFCNILSSFPKASIYLKSLDLSQNHLTSSCIGTILRLLQLIVIEKLVVSKNSINDSALTYAIFQLACYKWNEVGNLNSGIPLVIVNEPNMQQNNLLTDNRRYVTLFHMNCKIDEKVLTDYCSKAKIFYFLNSLMTFGDFRMNMTKLCNLLPSSVKVFVFERDLNDEVAQKAAIYLKKLEISMNFILASKTKILANGSSYHQIAPLLDGNTLVNTLQVTNFDMQLPRNCKFVRAFKTIRRNWEMIDLSCCNIGDDGCLGLQQCIVASKSTIRILKFISNNLSPVSALNVAKIILNCNVKKVNISNNKLQNIDVNNALSCLKRNSIRVMSVEIISLHSTIVTICNTDPKLLPYQSWSFNNNIQLSIMNYSQFHYVDHILSLFHKIKLSRVLLLNNGISLEQIEEIIKKFPRNNLYIEETYVQFDFKFIDYTFESLMNSFLNATSPFSSLLFIKVDMENNKICVYDNNIICSSIKDALTRLIHWQMSTSLVAVKLSNCYVTNNIAMELASIITKITDLKLFELSYNHIQESDLKEITMALKSTKSLIFFSIKSIDCCMESTAEDIASIIARNKSIKYLEISNCDMKQSAILKVAKSIKELRELKQLNLSNIALTCEALGFILKDKGMLEQLNLQDCKLLNPELAKISSALKHTKLNSINLSYNNISDYSAKALAYLLCNRSLNHLEMSNCNLQKEGMLCIINTLKYKSLKYLDFSGNRATYFLATEISAGISNNPNITHLDLSNCSLQEIGIVEILTSLEKHTSHLKSFKVSSITSNKEKVSLFKGVLKNNRGIENLTFQDCECEEIFDVIRRNLSCLQTLDICSSKISFQNLMCILANNINLNHLNMSNCNLQGEPDVVIEISGFSLEHVNLSENKITKSFAKFITKLIYTNYKLKQVDIANCEIQETELKIITNSLTLLTSLKCLNCSNLVISQQVAGNIAKIITNNVNLEHFDISLCNMTEEMFTPIINALKHLQALKHLNISGNYITIGGTGTVSSHKILLSSLSDKTDANTDDYDTISIAGSDSESTAFGEIMPLCSSSIYEEPILPTTDETLISSDGKSENSDDYDTRHSITPEVITEEPQYIDIPELTVLQTVRETSLSCKTEDETVDNILLVYDEITGHHVFEHSVLRGSSSSSSIDSCDYDTYSIHSETINISDILTTKNLTNSYRSSESLLPGDNAYETIDDMTHSNSNERLVDDYKTSPSIDKISTQFSCNQNSLVGSYELENESAAYEDNFSTDDKPISKHLSNKSSENLPYQSSSQTNVSIAISKITEVITCNCFLEYLDISYCNLSDLQIADVASALSEKSTLKHLNLSYNEITTDKTALKISSVIINNSLRNINLSNCHLQESGIIIIAEALANITSLISIDISENYIAGNSIDSVAAVVRENLLLEKLNLGYCFQYNADKSFTRNRKGVEYILMPLTMLTCLKYLDLHSSYVSEVASGLLPAVIASNELLSHLDLTDCKVPHMNLIAIAKKLQSTCTLKFLSLSSNVIVNEAAYELAVAIRKNNYVLEYLALSDCELEERGFIAIAESLLNISSLKHLDLSNNVVTDIELLPVVVANNKSLSHLDLTDCKLPHMKLIEIAKTLQLTCTLKFLSLSSNVIVNKAAYEFALAISKNFALQHLALSDCKLEERGFISIVESLLNISSIKHLNLSNNIITDKAAKTLASGIANNKKLTYLDLSYCTWQDIGFARIQEVVFKLPMMKKFDIRSL